MACRSDNPTPPRGCQWLRPCQTVGRAESWRTAGCSTSVRGTKRCPRATGWSASTYDGLPVCVGGLHSIWGNSGVSHHPPGTPASACRRASAQPRAAAGATATGRPSFTRQRPSDVPRCIASGGGLTGRPRRLGTVIAAAAQRLAAIGRDRPARLPAPAGRDDARREALGLQVVAGGPRILNNPVGRAAAGLGCRTRRRRGPTSGSTSRPHARSAPAPCRSPRAPSRGTRFPRRRTTAAVAAPSRPARPCRLIASNAARATVAPSVAGIMCLPPGRRR